MKLYEIPSAIRDALEKIDLDEETGEIINADLLDQVKEDSKNKILATFCFIKELAADKETLGKQIDNLRARQQSITKKIDWLKNECMKGMDALGSRKLKDPQVTGYFMSRDRVEITDEKNIPPEYLRIPPPEPMKTEIMKALKAGKEIAGAEIKTSVSLAIK